jgi:hypothetical protein
MIVQTLISIVLTQSVSLLRKEGLRENFRWVKGRRATGPATDEPRVGSGGKKKAMVRAWGGVDK